MPNHINNLAAAASGKVTDSRKYGEKLHYQGQLYALHQAACSPRTLMAVAIAREPTTGAVAEYKVGIAAAIAPAKTNGPIGALQRMGAVHLGAKAFQVPEQGRTRLERA